jgi:NAD(P)H-nitrite reductase large subunit
MLPYNRTSLSKEFPKRMDEILLRAGTFLKENDIDIFMEHKAILLNNHQKRVKFKNGESVVFIANA